MSSPAEAAVVAVCANAIGETVVRVADAPPRGCVTRDIAADARDILWAGALPRQPRAGEEVVLTRGEGGHRRVELRTIERPSSRPEALPIGQPLLSRLKARAFGREERVEVSATDDGLTIACTAGEAPAGVLLDPGPRRLPRDAALHLVAAHRGDNGFRLTTVAPDGDAEGGTRLDGAGTRVALRPGGQAAVQFVLLCPRVAGTLHLSALALEPATLREAPRSAWAWKPIEWRNAPEKLIAAAAARGVDRLHVAVDVANGQVRDAAALGRFIRLARARGLSVDAVEGDPRMVRPAGRDHALQRAAAIGRYQRSAPAAARFAGVQYDVEPYLLPEFGADRAGTLRAWSALMRDAAKLVGKIDVVVPFWLTEGDDGAAALDAVAPHVARVTVMAYRTEPAGVVAAAEPLLAWGARHGVPVRVALEMGRLPDETEERFRPIDRKAQDGGDLVLLPVGDKVAALLLREGAAVREGKALARAGTAQVRAERLSFMGDAGRMAAAAETLRGPLSAWPSFAGFAYHGLF